jgi:hypothetical protein
VHEAWQKQSAKIKEDADFVTAQLQTRLASTAVDRDKAIDPEWIQRCLGSLRESFDREFGGFGYAPHDPQRPKFPEPSNLLFLVDHLNHQTDDEQARQMLITTCERMLMGGIFDHIGGGFHRYSVDRFWSIPHFEKMLYDNAQLLTVYCQAYAMTGRADFQMAIEETVKFVLREMRDEGGAFYSALDAETEGEEGKFYRWEKQEISDALDENEWHLFSTIYGIDRAPNFEGQYYVPQFRNTLAELAAEHGTSEKELLARLEPIRQKLFDIRRRRPRPATDVKVLSSWNGMMIRGLADAGRVLKNDEYVKASRNGASFILRHLVNTDGRLHRTWTSGKPSLNAYGIDYACLIDGLLALHQATGDADWLNQAQKIQAVQDKLFWDEQNYGYFETSHDHPTLIARTKLTRDGPVPACNSISAGNLVYLAGVLKDAGLRERARRTVVASSSLTEIVPNAAPRLLISARDLFEIARPK